ncbi:hypothetical protein [Candidatus Clostridium radicumherbarum]|uniref:Uncharacterized protein n=1 Tax=Candidatus Clostridium radicumherbarum TaxID=3381662 RepID=A0ABW8TUQ0_9CLOT
MVSKITSIVGKNGTNNEFDVYYEFFHLSIRYRPAVECKDKRNPVSIGEVSD